MNSASGEKLVILRLIPCCNRCNLSLPKSLLIVPIPQRRGDIFKLNRELIMAKNNFYAVLYGRRTGVFSSWDEVKKYTHGYGE
ncbi:RNase H1/viroplasmin domain-containing protein, partial [Vibrio anguillarum]